MLIPYDELSDIEKAYDLDMAVETLKVLQVSLRDGVGFCCLILMCQVIGFNITLDPNRDSSSLRYLALPKAEFIMSNGYLPSPLDLEAIVLSEGLADLSLMLAENAHNVWASKRLDEGKQRR